MKKIKKNKEESGIVPFKIVDLTSRQSNDFIESICVTTDNLTEHKVVEFIISQIKNSDSELAKTNTIKVIEISPSEFAKVLNTPRDEIYRNARNIAINMTKRQYNFQYTDSKGKKAFRVGNFLTDMLYENNMIKISINPVILPYFIEVKAKFTEFQLKYLTAMNSTYGIRLYKLLKQYQIIGKREFSVEELRKHFNIENNKYKQYSDLKKYTILMAIKHINEYTDIVVELEEHKVIRSVKKLTFHIKSSNRTMID